MCSIINGCGLGTRPRLSQQLQTAKASSHCRVKSRSSKERERQSSIQFKFYIQLCIALLCLYVAFIAGIDRTERFPVCVLFSALIHYFSLTSVLWMSATCGFIFWILVVNPFSKTHFNNVHMLVVTVLCWGECNNNILRIWRLNK